MSTGKVNWASLLNEIEIRFLRTCEEHMNVSTSSFLTSHEVILCKALTFYVSGCLMGLL
jgi:hypothetical protein